MRLDKFISQATHLSRRQVHILIKRGAVTVNDNDANSAALHIKAEDVITLDGKPVNAPQPQYIMLNKPAGYVCANSDSEHPIVLDLFDTPNKIHLQIVGRLDVDTTGLVLLTDDGRWNHCITSPKSDCNKTYRLTTAEPIAPSVIARFAEGILLHGEAKLTLPAQLELLGKFEARLTLHEGKYHQVKRMFAATGNRVVSLHRESIGKIVLDHTLRTGQHRPLTPTEVASVGND